MTRRPARPAPAVGLALAAALAAALPQAARAAERLVLVPFENATRAGGARAVVMPAVRQALEARGYEVVEGERVEAYLRSRRIRWLDSLTPSQAVELQVSESAAGVVTGSILGWDAAPADPAVALAVRVIGPGGDLLWTGLQGLSGKETEGAFGLGRAAGMEALVRRALGRLLEPLPRGRLADAVRPRPAGDAGPRVFRSRAMPAAPLRVCVLPLLNFSEAREAPRVLDAALHQRLAERPGLSVVDPAELRAAVVQGHLRAPAQLGPSQLQALARLAGTPLFLRGVILGYGRAEGDLEASPGVELYLTLVNVETGETLWSGLHRRAGLDYEGLLRVGAVRHQATLAGRVVGELLEAFARP